MRCKKILFPTDFSDASQAVLPLVTTLAVQNDAKLIILHAEESPPPFAGRDQCFAQRELPIRSLKRLLRSIVPPDHRVLYEHRLVIGNSADMIVRIAQKEGVDLIVMGTHGRGAIARLIMGSTATAVARRAPCTLLTYRPTKCLEPCPQYALARA